MPVYYDISFVCNKKFVSFFPNKTVLSSLLAYTLTHSTLFFLLSFLQQLLEDGKKITADAAAVASLMSLLFFSSSKKKFFFLPYFLFVIPFMFNCKKIDTGSENAFFGYYYY
jgi:hypothetical protein